MENKSNAQQIPQEVQQLHEALTELSAFRAALKYGMFPGNYSEVVAKLIKHIDSEYQQILDKFNNHPFVKAARNGSELLE